MSRAFLKLQIIERSLQKNAYFKTRNVLNSTLNLIKINHEIIQK